MYLTTDSESLKVYEALASEVRLRIIDLLSSEEMHIKEIAARLYLSSAIVSSHVAKLQKAGIVSSQMKRIDGGLINSAHFPRISCRLNYPGPKASLAK